MYSSMSRKCVRLAGVVLASGLCVAFLAAQPAGPKGKGRRPPEPPAAAEFKTVTGTVREFTTAPKGEVDGLILRDGTRIHWPPHLEDRFTAVAAKGDRVRAAGFWETTPAGDTQLEVSTLTNLASNKSADNPDRPAAGPRPPARDEDGDVRTVRGRVKEMTTAPRGEVDGAVLEDGTRLHWPPHLQDRFAALVKVGERVEATGRTETGPRGDTHFEVRSVTNPRTGARGENDAPPPAGPRRAARGPDREQRLQALEDQLEQMRKEIARLRREK